MNRDPVNPGGCAASEAMGDRPGIRRWLALVRDGIARGLKTGQRPWILGTLALFMMALAAVMIVQQTRRPSQEPWRWHKLVEAKERLVKEPKNEALMAEVRDLDHALRATYFKGIERNRSGAWLLLTSGTLFLILARAAIPRDVPKPTREPAPRRERERLARYARATTLVVGATLGIAFAISGWLPGVQRTSDVSEVLTAHNDHATGNNREGRDAIAPTSDAGPSTAQLARNWPRFRGFDGSGVSSCTNLPLSWDLASGEGVLWKSPVALEGYSSPVVWEGKVVVTGGDKKNRLVFCLDAATGRLVWQRPVTPTNAPAQAVQPSDQSGVASSTVATDGTRIFALFGTGELGALDWEGNLLWSRRLDLKDNSYGHAASLVTWQDRLLIQADQGAEEDGKSMLFALDTRTGEPHWVVKRPVGASWVTPFVAEIAGKPQLITAGDPWMIGYELAQGRELWRAKVLGDELAPSPILAGGLIIAASPGRALLALRPDGQGDVTATHVAWRTEDGVPDVPSPTSFGQWLFTSTTEGTLICREAATGEKVWEQEMEFGFEASPLVAGDRVYLFGQPGNVMVIRAAAVFEVLSAFEMGEEVFATPAMVEDRLYIRTRENLVAVGKGSQTSVHL